MNSGTSSYAGQIIAATHSTINAGGGALTLTGGLVKNGTTLTIAGGGRVNVNAIGISGASASSDLVVDGTTLVVNASSNYNGPTTVQNSGVLIANAEIDTTNVTITAGSKLSGTSRVDVASGGYFILNGTLQVGDSTLGSPVASVLEIATAGAGSTLLGAGSELRFDLFSNIGNNLAITTAADYIKLFGTLDATLGGTLVLGNPNALSGFDVGDQWRLFDLSGGGINTGIVVNTTALSLTPGLGGFFDHTTGILSIVAIPEPGRAMLLLLGALSMVMVRKRPHWLWAGCV